MAGGDGSLDLGGYARSIEPVIQTDLRCVDAPELVVKAKLPTTNNCPGSAGR